MFKVGDKVEYIGNMIGMPMRDCHLGIIGTISSIGSAKSRGYRHAEIDGGMYFIHNLKKLDQQMFIPFSKESI